MAQQHRNEQDESRLEQPPAASASATPTEAYVERHSIQHFPLLQAHLSSGTSSSRNIGGVATIQFVPRSNPIAITKLPVGRLQTNGADNNLVGANDEDDDDDDDDSVIDVERDALKLEQRRLQIRRAVLGEAATFDDDSDAINEVVAQLQGSYENELRKCPSSLPSRLLLRAPLLASVPINDDLTQYHCLNLPPPMSLAKECNGNFGDIPSRPLQYGSLRESHSRGRFLDGPSSYRDARTGDIRRVQNRVRFQNLNSTCEQKEPFLSIGERIMQSSASARNQLKKDGKVFASSSLSAMLSASNADIQTVKKSPTSLKTPTDTFVPLEYEEPISRQITFHEKNEEPTNRPRAFYEEELEFDCAPARMLSTSLTGLEVLQAGLCLGKQSAFTNNHETQTELPKISRDASGDDMYLTRSRSEPTLHLRSRLQQQRANNATSPLILSRSVVDKSIDEHGVAQSRYQLHPFMPKVLLPPGTTMSTITADSNLSSFTLPAVAIPVKAPTSCPNSRKSKGVLQSDFVPYAFDDSLPSLTNATHALHNNFNNDGSSTSLLIDDDDNFDIEGTFDMELE